MKVFVDANVFVDIFHADRAFHHESVAAYRSLIKNHHTIMTSCDLMTTIYYIDAKKDKRQALVNIKNILKTLQVIEFSNDEIEAACDVMEADETYFDLEDTLQYILAQKHQCHLILSNDKKFASKDIPVLTTEEFCQKDLSFGKRP